MEYFPEGNATAVTGTLMNGFCRTWFANGQLQFEGYYKEGMMHGVWRSWFENGQLRTECPYKDGKADGVWRYWSRDGTLEREDMWKGYTKIVPEPPLSKKRTQHPCIVYKDIPPPGSKYLECTFSEEHVVDHAFITEFSKTTDLGTIKCLYCRYPLKAEVFEQIE